MFPLIILILISGSVSAQEYGFEQAWHRLLLVSDALQAEQQQVNRARAEQEASHSLDYPSVSIGGSYTHLEKPLELDLRDLNPLASLEPSSLPPALGAAMAAIPNSLYVTPFTEQDVFRASLQAMWPIYTGGKITAAHAIHAAEVTEKEQQKLLKQRQLFTALVDRYYAVSVTQTLMNTQQQLVSSLSHHAEHAQKLEAQGQIAKVERLNAQVALENARVSLGSSKRQYEMAQIALSRMLHQQSVLTNSPLFMLERLPSLPDLTQLTLHQHPALRLLDAKAEQAEGLVAVELGSYKPTVFLYGNYTLYEDDSLFSKMEPDWMVGVGVRMPLLSRDGRSGKVLAAKSALLQAQHTKAQTTQDLSLLVDQSYRRLLQAQEEVLALNASLSLAKENLKLRDLAFSQGLSTSIERVDAQLKLTAVSTQQLGARYRYVQAFARLMAVSGQVDEFIGRSKTSENSHAHK
ncbi:TolC family protein [Shewanella gelidii]|nr:TolC family protein [Shewanella gelidii]MCL1098772.1 TolC family protein [Shewanella gelidii]